MKIKRELFRKTIAWSLIAAMVNPALMAPAYARDSDIYLQATTGTSTAEPNVLFVLGTNDRMNVAEGWREYDPTTYDSHAEYLWNDINVIGAAEVIAESTNSISDIAPPVNPWSPWGTWSGALTADRKALWQATLAYANGIQAGDPAARSTYRNYNDLSWLYWVPTGTVTTDARLRSVSFNRFRGYQQMLAGTRGGVTFPAAGASAAYKNANNFQAMNQCASSLNALQPSTVFMPATVPANTGVYTKQQWARWEQWQGLATNNNSTYPGADSSYNGTCPVGYGGGGGGGGGGGNCQYAKGYLDGTAAPASPQPPGSSVRDDFDTSTTIKPKNDQFDGNGPIGIDGQPIRIQGVVAGVASYAGWTDLKADMGGFEFAYQVKSMAQTVLASNRAIYGYATKAGNSALKNEQFAAWYGNRDAAVAPAFGKMTGTSAYYDVTQGCDRTAGPAGNECIAEAVGQVTATWKQNCTVSGAQLKEKDAAGQTNTTGGACAASGAVTCSTSSGATCTSLGLSATVPPAPMAVPTCGAPSTQNSFTTVSYTTNCSWSGQASVTVAACAWVNRQSVLIEGAPPNAGWFFYGGQCLESGSPTNCQIGAGASAPPAPATFSASKVVNGVSQSNVVGGIANGPTMPAGGMGYGCSNKVNAGTYKSGGVCGGAKVTTCSATALSAALRGVGTPNCNGYTTNVATNPPAVCQVQGGNSISISGGPLTTYNQNCNTPNDTTMTCTARYPGDPAPVCFNQCNNSTTAAYTVTPATTYYYQVFNLLNSAPPLTNNQRDAFANAEQNLVHDCKADEPALNPGGSYMIANARTWNTPWNGNVGNGNSNLAASYDNAVGQAIPAVAAKNIDVYSVNYLNFLYGAKACRDSTGALITVSPVSTPPAGATCSPIARKTRLQVAKDALSNLVLLTDGVRLGLMVYNKTDASQLSEGGNIAYAIRRMGSNAADPNYANRASLVTAIQSQVASSRTPLTEVLYEAYRYYAGRTPVFGTLATAAAIGGAVSAARETSVGNNSDTPVNTVYLLNATGTYNSPMLNNPNVASPANCQKNYVVMITNGQAEEDSSANAAIKTMAYAGANGTTVSPRTDFDTYGATPNNAGAPDYHQIPTVAGGSPMGPTDAAGTAVDGGYVWLDELTYFIDHADVSPGAANYQSEYKNCSNPIAPGHQCDTPLITDQISGRQSIATYTIGFAGVSAPVVQNAAAVAGGVFYIAQNAQQLQAALLATLTAIKNWNPTAAAATVPISSLNRGESSTDVYLAFFGPSISSVWPGTVKKYQISTLASDCGANIPLCLTGQNKINGLYNIETLDPVTGQSIVDPTATSGPNDLQHPPGSAWYAATVGDGAQPSKGGTGHVLVNTTGYTPDQRKIYTYLTDSVTMFAAGNISGSTDLTVTANSVDYIANSANITQCRLGDAAACGGAATMSFATKETLISYIRGGNLGDTNCTDGSTGTVCSTWTTWPHASVEHSKPVIVTYDGSVSPPVQYMYYLQNNGLLTAVDTNTGLEKWSFLIEEALPRLQDLENNLNAAEIYLADGSPSLFYDDANNDGVINGADRVWIYFGLRRGGRAYYALDITNKDKPVFKWKITAEQPAIAGGSITTATNVLTVPWVANFAVGQTITVAGAGGGGADLTTTISAINVATKKFTLAVNASSTVVNARVTTAGTSIPAKVCNGTSACSAVPAYNELGQTWSQPAIVKLKALFGVTNNPPALIFGGGYDIAEDTVPPGTRTMGRAVYVVNGDTAAIVRGFGAGQGNVATDFRGVNMLTTYAIPSDVTSINTDFDAQGYVDRLVVGDMGGNVWRFDVDDPVPGNWKGELLASLSNASGEKRKFFFPPAVAPQTSPFRFDAVYIGSGDKEHPLLTSSTTPPTTTDYMFMLMDDPSLNSGGGTPDTTGPSVRPTPSTLATLIDVANVSTTGADVTSLSAGATTLTGHQGWFRELENGEKVINAPTVFKLGSQISRLRFGTFAPLTQLNACSPPGEGRLNEIDSLSGDLLPINGASAGPQRWYSGFLSRGYMSSTQLLILPSGGSGSPKTIYQFNCADANCQGSQIGTLGAPTKIYWYMEPEQ